MDALGCGDHTTPDPPHAGDPDTDISELYKELPIEEIMLKTDFFHLKKKLQERDATTDELRENLYGVHEECVDPAELQERDETISNLTLKATQLEDENSTKAVVVSERDRIISRLQGQISRLMTERSADKTYIQELQDDYKRDIEFPIVLSETRRHLPCIPEGTGGT